MSFEFFFVTWILKYQITYKKSIHSNLCWLLKKRQWVHNLESHYLSGLSPDNLNLDLSRQSQTFLKQVKSECLEGIKNFTTYITFSFLESNFWQEVT